LGGRLSFTAEDFLLIRYLGSLPRKNNRVKVDIAKLGETTTIDMDRFLEKLVFFQSLGLITITGIPKDDTIKSKLIRLVRQIDYRFLANRIPEVDYDAVRRAAAELILRIPGSSLNDVPPSPILMGELIRQRSHLISSLLNLLYSKEYDTKTSDELVKSLKEVEATLEEIEGMGGAFGSDMYSMLQDIREKLEEDLLRTVIGELEREKLELTVSQTEERLEEIVQALGRYFLTESNEAQVTSYLKVELELLRARLHLGEITKEEYNYLYRDLLRKAKAGQLGSTDAYLKVIDAVVKQLGEQLEALKAIKTHEFKIDKTIFEIMESRTQKTVSLLGDISDEIKRITKLLERVSSYA
jgi:hypothetical protein